MDGGEECARELVVARGDCSEPLKFAEKTLNEVAFAIERKVGPSLHDAIGFGRNHRLDAALLERFDQGVGVIGFVRKKRLRRDFFEQRSRLADI